MRRPLMIWVMVLILVLLALGGFSGGIPMLIDPENGGYLDFGEILPLLPVPNFILPGLFLFVVLGLYPLFLTYALIAMPEWHWVGRFFQWSKYHWAWLGTLVLVAIVAVWLLYEGWLIGWFPITYITAVQGSLILVLAVLPSVRKYCERK